MFAASKTASVSASAPEDKFNYVTMLLHGDGTNGAQNNTFVDSSTNNFSITRNGNTTQGSFSPYGSNWSNNFLSSANSYLNFGNQTALHLGSGNFTIEMWLWKNANTGLMTACGDFAVASTNTFQILADATGTKLDWYNGATNTSTITSVSSIPTNTWTHIAFVRNSTTLTLYINGVSDVSATLSTDYNATTSFFVGHCPELNAGRYWNGYISNLRLVKGTAVYTSNFTPSTTPLTAITNTSLLTCQSNRFKDSSSNNFAVTVNGTPSVERFNPFGTATAYSTSVIGGSGYFDGSDHLSASANTAFNITGDFTVEAWVYFTALPAGNDSGNRVASISGYSDTTANVGWEIGIDFTNNKFSMASWGTSNKAECSFTPVLNTWYHFAITKSSSTTRIFINGVSQTLTTNSLTINAVTGTLNIARSSSVSGYFHYTIGYISDFRIVKGTALYTTTFTPPTSPLTAITNTSLLTNMTNGAIFDNAMITTLETVGDAQISTSVVKYGTGSLKFDGTGDSLKGKTVPIGNKDLTIECWVYLNVATGDQHFVQVDGASDSNVFLSLDSGANKFRFVVRNDAGTNNCDLFSSISPSANTWYHIAGVIGGGGSYLFVNGSTTSGATGGVSGTRTATGTNAYLGVNGAGGARPFNGYLDDVRITAGYARYTANFTAPTAAFSDTGPI